mmetsp:Transcript_4872/g.12062  ORF Transcript_4872/g.12062 Transcript_4872/m.12062 type:complete len:200 (+) Transcript_4872:1508-2107(+)
MTKHSTLLRHVSAPNRTRNLRNRSNSSSTAFVFGVVAASCFAFSFPGPGGRPFEREDDEEGPLVSEDVFSSVGSGSGASVAFSTCSLCLHTTREEHDVDPVSVEVVRSASTLLLLTAAAAPSGYNKSKCGELCTTSCSSCCGSGSCCCFPSSPKFVLPDNLTSDAEELADDEDDDSVEEDVQLSPSLLLADDAVSSPAK